MIKNFIMDIKLSRLSYLLEVIEVRDFRSKIKAYNKIRKMKLTKEMGELILRKITPEKLNTTNEVNIYLSLLALVVSVYESSYETKVIELFKDLTVDSKYEILNILSFNENTDSIMIYKKLLLKYYDGSYELPIGTISNNINNYKLLFPDLFKMFDYGENTSSLLLILSDFINLGVNISSTIKKNKKHIQNIVEIILKKGTQFKFNNKEHIMQNKDYINLRIMLEAAINIELYVSSKKTRDYLEKLMKKKDNQLKLFILENYVKQGKDISKINLSTIARDNLSRYPLYSFLMYYNLERLMPKKYANNISLSESDLYINYCINYTYSNIPFDFEFIEERVISNHKYYFYKFKTNYNYSEEIKDPTTDYILNNASIDKKKVEKAIIEYIGVSGGYNKDLDPSIIEKSIPKLLIIKNENNTKENIDKLEKSISDDVLNEQLVIKEKKNKKKKEKVKKEKKNRIKSILLFIPSLFKKKKKQKEDISNSKDKKNSKIIHKEEPKEEIKEEKEEYYETRLIRKVFSLNTLYLIISLILFLCLGVLFTYLKDMDILKLKNISLHDTSVNSIKATTINNSKFKEVFYTDIFKQKEKEYYVLFYKNKQISVYYSFVETLLENDYQIYYVDINNAANKPIFEGNESGFVIKGDTYLKVNEGDYEFYVVDKTNILKEMKSAVEKIENKKKEEEEAKRAAETVEESKKE